MSQRQRGQEVTTRFTVDDVPLTGSFIKLTEFTVTPRQEIVEEEFLGELESDLDFRHDGWDLAGNMHVQDSTVLSFMDTIVTREQNQEAHPDIAITVIHRFRANLDQPRIAVYHDVFMMFDEYGFSGRKEYTVASFTAKAKRRTVLRA